MGVSICLNFLVKACQNGREKVPPVCASFRPEEDVNGGGALQAWQRPYQSQRPPAPPRRTPHPPPKAGGAAVAFGQGSVLGRRHQSPRQWRWSHRSSLRDSSSHFQVFGRLLPEVRRRGFEEGDQGHPHLLRSIAPRSRPQEERAQEVRRSWRQSQIPEILPLKGRKRRRRCESSSSAAAAPWRRPEASRGKRQTGRIYIYLSFFFFAHCWS